MNIVNESCFINMMRDFKIRVADTYARLVYLLFSLFSERIGEIVNL